MDTALTRRNLLKYSLAGAASIGLGSAVPLGERARTSSPSALPAAAMPKPFQQAFKPQQRLQGKQLLHPTEGPYTLFEVTERQGTATIVPGFSTPVWAYNGQVPGQYISVDQGTKVKLRVRNQLPATHPQFGHSFATSTHLHGSASKPQFDGFANDVTEPSQYKDYWYPNWQPARTLWYHDHGVHFTAQNAYGGLAAQYHLHDAAERALLPQGDYDVPLTVNDAMFAADGSLAYNDHTQSGLWGDVILVNGTPWPVMPVQRRVYRFRLLNASIARSFNFRLVDAATGAQVPVWMVATDGGLMPKAVQLQSWRHGGAERYEFLVDFRKVAPGSRIELRNASNANNIDYANTGKVMRFDVGGDYDPITDPVPGNPNTIPGTLVPSEPMSLPGVSAASVPTTTLRVERSDLLNMWTINQRSWHDIMDSGYQEVVANPRPNEVQVWQIENRSGGWFHPVHIHLVDFQILSRTGGAGKVLPQEAGPKDVVYVGEGEVVKVAMKFRLNPDSGPAAGTNAGGRYMVHCHNLPHEDHDMMVQFAVGDKNVNDPITTAQAQPDTGVYDDGRLA
jgi:FtsP/CotA-like multicopper oxidase with cupredoxin domain